MNGPNIVSPAGVVHAGYISVPDDGYLETAYPECGPPDGHYAGDGYDADAWRWTDAPVTCRRCLRMGKERGHA